MNLGGDQNQPNSFGAGGNPYPNPTPQDPTLSGGANPGATPSTPTAPNTGDNTINNFNYGQQAQNLGYNQPFVSQTPNPQNPTPTFSAQDLNATGNKYDQQSEAIISGQEKVSQDLPQSAKSILNNPNRNRARATAAQKRDDIPEFFNEALAQKDIILQNEQAAAAKNAQNRKKLIIAGASALGVIAVVALGFSIFHSLKKPVDVPDEPKENTYIEDLTVAYNKFVNLIEYGEENEEAPKDDNGEELRLDEKNYFESATKDYIPNLNRKEYFDKVIKSYNTLESAYRAEGVYNISIPYQMHEYFSIYPNYVPASAREFAQKANGQLENELSKLIENKYLPKQELISDNMATTIENSRKIDIRTKQMVIEAQKFGCIKNETLDIECTRKNDSLIRANADQISPEPEIIFENPEDDLRTGAYAGINTIRSNIKIEQERRKEAEYENK